jgi:hypothetical protein
MSIKWQNISFYTAAIGGVLLLFKVVTTYGENNIKAPSSIEGKYQIQADNLPECLKKSHQSILDLQQSGIYVFASWQNEVKKSQEKAIKTKPHLAGKIHNNQELNLSGVIPKIADCDNFNVKIESKIIKDELTGKIIMFNQQYLFTAEKIKNK